MPRATEALISLSALRHNLSRVAELAPASRIWAVVKADAYGHGLEAVLPALDQADGLGLVEFDRAQRLRELGWSRPILMMEGPFGQTDVEQAARYNLSLVIHEPRQISWLSKLAPWPRLDLHLKLNSGMNRLGFSSAEYRDAWEALRACAGVGEITLMTHFANADRVGGAEAALSMFDRVAAGLPGPHSLANSAAVLDYSPSHRDWVRPGIMLYGCSPFQDRSAQALGLRAVMTFRSELISVQRLSPGDTVGYGSTFVADRSMRVGIVACGYADGYPRHAPTGTPIAVAGVRCRTLGRVSMDMLAVDLEPIPGAQPGLQVELWGEQVSVDEVAASAGTIGYELTCAIANRVVRTVAEDHG
jgi:alanine racemase